MVNVGITGLNTMECYFIEQQFSLRAPEITLCPVTHPLEAEQLEALILGQIACIQWMPYLPDTLPLLVFTEACNYQISGLTKKQATMLCWNDSASVLQTNIARWLDVLARPANQDMPRRRARNSFSQRESQVLELLREGTSNEGIAKLLGIKPSTVKTYLRRVYERLGATNRTHAVALYKAHAP